MPLPPDLLTQLNVIPPPELARIYQASELPKPGIVIELRNEIRPSDLFCYLGARFGPPNGLHNFFRKDDSDNLIHWEWTLSTGSGILGFLGMNFRTEVHLMGHAEVSKSDAPLLVETIKQDFAARGQEMGAIRSRLESWIEFVNPYQRVWTSIETLASELEGLGLDLEKDKIDDFGAAPSGIRELAEEWNEAAERYTRAFGLCFGIRSMLPVAAEAFVNLLLYILMRPELRSDSRLADNAVRQPIDVRIKSLPLNCIGFARTPDFGGDVCRNYHSLANARNDLLHGNVSIDKLAFNEVYFWGRVPVFREYRSMWDRSLRVSHDTVGLDRVRAEIKVVEDLVAYLLSCLEDPIREEVERLTGRTELGFNTATKRLGILFPEWLVDFRAFPGSGPSQDGVAAPDDSATGHPTDASPPSHETE